MTDYVKATNFAAKDALPSGDANKKVRGTEINDELTSIQTAIATKLDKASPSMTGTPLAPSPSLAADNTQIVTTEWVRDIINAYEPLGTIKAWAGSVGALPTGWALCNGTSGTLNLTDRFIVGFGGGFAQNNPIGAVASGLTTAISGITTTNGAHSHGGATFPHTLTVDQIPAHSHVVEIRGGSAGGPFEHPTQGTFTTPTNQITQSTGGGQSHQHSIFEDGSHFHSVSGVAAVPGFFVLAFIQKIALL